LRSNLNTIKMQILKNIYIQGNALYLKNFDALVFSDLQIGLEDELISKGILVPRFHNQDIIKIINQSLKKNKKTKINYELLIINGDFKHDFSKFAYKERQEAQKLIDYFKNIAKEIIFIEGNHDTFIINFCEKNNIKIVDTLILDNILLTHGHKKVDIPEGIKTIIIGHLHPAVVLKTKIRHERYKCFLKGKFKTNNNDEIDLIIIPSLNPTTIGSDVLSETDLFIKSPFINNLKNLNNFEIFISENEILSFGKIKELKKL
jgi:uncharacterized protein